MKHATRKISRYGRKNIWKNSTEYRNLSTAMKSKKICATHEKFVREPKVFENKEFFQHCFNHKCKIKKCDNPAQSQATLKAVNSRLSKNSQPLLPQNSVFCPKCVEKFTKKHGGPTPLKKKPNSKDTIMVRNYLENILKELQEQNNAKNQFSFVFEIGGAKTHNMVLIRLPSLLDSDGNQSKYQLDKIQDAIDAIRKNLCQSDEDIINLMLIDMKRRSNADFWDVALDKSQKTLKQLTPED